MRVSVDAVETWLFEYRNHIRSTYALNVFRDYSYDGAACRFDDTGKPVGIRLNTNFVKSSMFFGTINMDNFAGLFLAAQHEERHVMQNERYRKDTNLDGNWKQMCEHFIVSTKIPEFYWAAYGRDPNELDAELWAIKKTREYFKEKYPNYDVDSAILRYANSETNADRKFDEDFVSVDEVIACYENMLYEDTVPAVDIFSVQTKNGPSPMMMKLKQNEMLCNKLAGCKTLGEQRRHLSVFLKKECPSYFVQFPSMQEVEKSNSSRKTCKSGFLDAVKRGSSGYQEPFIDEYYGLEKH